MNSDLFNLIRFTMVILAIVTFVILCVTDERRYYPVHEESPCLEPAETESL